MSGLVNQTLDFADGRIVYRPDCFAAAAAFDGESKAHGFVTDVEFALAHGAFRLGSYIVEFVRHSSSIAEARSSANPRPISYLARTTYLWCLHPAPI